MDSPDSEGSPSEVIYGSSGDETSISMVAMSDMVQSMASTIYGEFERMIKNYGDPVVHGLMPQLVAVLENWDRTIKEKQDIQLELDLTREDNEQLLNQYEREKQLRRSTEQNYIEVQDTIDEQRKELGTKLEAMEKSYKVLELKSKNCQDHVMRLEEKEGEVKREYDKLHSRYTELFRTHMDHMERTKALIGQEKMDSSGEAMFSDSSRLSASGASSGAASGARQTVAATETGNGFENPLLAGIADGEVSHGQQNGRAGVTSQVQGARRQGLGLGKDLNVNDTGVTSPIGAQSGGGSSSSSWLSRTSMEAAASALVVDELEPEMEASDADDGSSQLTGMTREVENLIKENQELIQMKNALSVVKDDLIGRLDDATAELELSHAEQEAARMAEGRLRARLTDLEDEVKKMRDAVVVNANAVEDDETPSSQRKRFTRVEMARVILERNQYKERLMELQEAVRWTEMIRASREHPDTPPGKKKSSIWNFFSNLFTPPNKHKRLPAASLHYSAPTTQVRPVGDPNRPRRSAYELGEKAKAYDFLQDDLLTDGARRQKEEERKEQYRKVQAHVRRDDSGRVQAYGWSVPNRSSQQQQASPGGSGASPLTVPVPVYCRPLVSNEDAVTKLCCAAAMLPAVGRTRDGGSVVGSSVFYSSMEAEGDGRTGCAAVHPGAGVDEESEQLSPGVAELSHEITEHQRALADAERGGQKRSSLVWICTAAEGASKVVVIDASNPAECLESFSISGQRAVTIACVPGASDKDYPDADNHGGVQCKPAQPLPQPLHPLQLEDDDVITEPCLTFVEAASDSNISLSTDTSQCCSSEGSSTSSVPPPSSEGAVSTAGSIEVDQTAVAAKMVLPTMWITTESGWLYIYAAAAVSTAAHRSRCLRALKLSTCGVCIAHARGKVFVGLANGTVAVFHRNSDGCWCTDDYHVLDFGGRSIAVRCAVAVASSRVWLGFKNCIYVVNAETLQVEARIEAHPRRESQVRLLAWAGGDGVWASIRLDSTLRLFHAYTHARLQDVDVEPYVDKMLGAGKLGFSFSRVTALDISCGRLWIGTGNGVIISLPLADGSNKETECSSSRQSLQQPLSAPGGAVRVYCDSRSDRVTPASYIPYCGTSLAQLSFHGHRDAVRFFVTVSSLTSSRSSLVMSGGEGYVDFRVGADDDDSNHGSSDPAAHVSQPEVPPRMWSHLIVWEVANSGSH